MAQAYKILPSTPYPLGVRREGKSIFASMISDEPNCGILLYNTADTTSEPLKIPFPAHQKVGHIYSMRIDGIPAYYNGYRVYKEADILCDEYGRCYVGYPYGTALENSQMMALLEQKAFDWDGDKKPAVAFSDAIFYGLHVRGFTMGAGSKCRHKGTFAGVKEKLDYLSDLGITSVLMMPAYEFIENEQPNNTLNYWGYKKGYYYAPKASYAAGKDPCTEMKQLVRACHEKGMELFMQFYFPEEISEPEIIRVLEYWVTEYHIDGFQVMAGHVNINIIKNAPLLAATKFIYYDFEDGGHQAMHFSQKTDKRLCIYLDNTMKDYRRFLRGEEGTLEGVMYHFRKNGSKVAFLNSIADYNSFRIADTVSYSFKHNEVNGENNSDGSNYNYSWNCGVEGPTTKHTVLQLRTRQIKNALSMIFLSQGTPYLFMGDEMGSTQLGNNNPYNQDNDISWLDWKGLTQNKEIYQFTKDLIAYRKAHKILHMDNYLAGTDIMGCGFPDISFHGLEAYKVNREPYHRELGILLCGKYARERDGREDKMIYIIYNMYWESRTFELPKLKKEAVWHVALKTTQEDIEIAAKDGKATSGKRSEELIRQERIVVPPRTIIVLES